MEISMIAASLQLETARCQNNYFYKELVFAFVDKISKLQFKFQI